MNENQNAESRAAVEDVEGHRVALPHVDGVDDVEGHRRTLPNADSEEADDVSGHVQPPRDLDIER
jgi:hypothetical protein